MATMRTEHPRFISKVPGETLAFLCLLLALSVSDARSQTIDPTETIRVDADLVDLKVSVVRLNPDSPPLTLRQEDFRVLEDGKPQEIAFFAGEDAPFDLVLLLDLSGSTADKLNLIKRSAKRFVETVRPLDRIAIVTFTDVSLIESHLTWDRKLLRDSIDRIEKPHGGTNFWDSLRYVMATMSRSEQSSRRNAIVVMTDGVDNALPDVFGEGSQTSFDELREIVGRSDILVFPIYLDTEEEEVRRHRNPRSAYEIARTQLAQLADSCGTRLYRADKLKDLDKVYDQVIRDLGTVYSIGYRPTNTLRDGKWRSVVVQLIGGQNLAARTKRGYYAMGAQ
jgi:Ca-activated chloride channel homolog